MALYGRQAIAELHGCNPKILDDADRLQEIMTHAAEVSGAHIVKVVSHKFSPQGASVVVVIAESHISIHTWPELGFAAVDIFSCSARLDLTVAWENISRGLEAREVVCKVLPRLQEQGPGAITNRRNGGNGRHPRQLVFTSDWQMIEVDERISRRETEWQTLELVRTRLFGDCLLLDQIPQSSDLDEFIYHEALVHPALLSHPEPRRILIIGGGEGATAREVLRHPTVERVVMVDIDEGVVEFSKENLESWHQGSFADPRMEVLIEDGRDYLEHCREGFDCIVVDLNDYSPISPASRLYTTEFYQLLSKRLAPRGIMATHAQGLGPAYLESHLRNIAALKRVFAEVTPYRAFIPVFSQEWAFATASALPLVAALDADEVDRRIAERGLNHLRFYDGATHSAMTTMPKYVREHMAQTVEPLNDAELSGVLARGVPRVKTEPVGVGEG